MRRRAGLVALAVVVVCGGALPLLWPDDRPLTLAEQHWLEEEHEEELTEELMEEGKLIAPEDNAQDVAERPYDSSNAGGPEVGGKAVAYHAGGRVDDSPDVVAAAPEGRLWRTGYGSWEPTLGVDKEGTIFFSARNTNADPGIAISKDAGRTWKRVTPPNHEVSLDPYVWVDEKTGSVFASDIDPPVTCTPVSRSDDQGKTWTYSRACGVTDHQNHFGGPPPAGGEEPSGYPNVLYYCAISGGTLSDSSTFTGCLNSLDGGGTWLPTGDPPYPPKQDEEQTWCDGPVGHGMVDRDGTVYLPRGWCGPPTIAISKDEGATWERREISDKIMGNGVHESAVAADSAGNLYYLWVSDEHRPYLSISRDGGDTWSEEVDVMPPGVNNVSAFSSPIDAGGEGEIAFVFMGTSDAEPDEESVWSAYMGTSSNALSSDPLFYVAPANDPATNALWKGLCEDLRCGNIGDFLDVEIGPDGSAWTALVDSCPDNDECITDLTITTPRGEGVVGQLTPESSPAGRNEAPSAETPPAGTSPQERRSCPRRRRVSMRLPKPEHGRLKKARVYVNDRRARVYVNGERVRVVRGRRLRERRLARFRVNVTRLRGRTFKVRVVGVTPAGERVKRTRRYRRCPT